MQRIIASILIQWLLIGNASTAFSLPVEASTLSPEINLSQADVRGQFSQAQTVRSEQRIISWPKERKILNVPAVSASLLDVNPADLPMMSREAWRAGLEYYHIDHMDGNFVSNRVDGLAMMRVLREVDYGSIFDYADQEKAKRRPLFDAHLMVSDVSEGLIGDFIEAGADILTFHYEAVQAKHQDPASVIAAIRACAAKHERKVQVGISIRPETALSEIYPFLNQIDFVLIMTVSPGEGGQEFLPGMLEKINQLRAYIDRHRYPVKISVDGGITRYYAWRATRAGANVIVAGSSIFKQAAASSQRLPKATVAKAIEALRNASVSSAEPLYATQQRRIVSEVIRLAKLARSAHPENMQYRSILNRYYTYLKEIKRGKRVALPKYYYGVSEAIDEQAMKDMSTILDQRMLPYHFINFGDDGIFFRDRIVTRKMLDDSGMQGFFFKDYRVWLSLPSDIELEGKVVYVNDEASLGKVFRFTVPATSRYPDYGILLHFAKIGAIVIADGQDLLNIRGAIRALPLVKNNRISVISIEEAQLERDLLDQARRIHDRFNMLKEGKYEFDWIKPRINGKARLREFNELETGDIVLVTILGNEYYGFIRVQDGRRYVTYLDTENALTGGMLNRHDFTTKEIAMLADGEDTITYSGHRNRINFNTIRLTNTRIKPQEMGGRNFLRYLLECDTRLHPSPEYQSEEPDDAVNSEQDNYPGNIIHLRTPERRMSHVVEAAI